MGSRARRRRAGLLSRRFVEHRPVFAHRADSTRRREQSRSEQNPDLDYLLRGTVHDTTARRMGGVAGHAGVFSTAHDVSIYAQALLDRLAGRPSNFPLNQATLELMTTPQQPGHSAEQLQAANDAAREAVAKTPNTTNPLLASGYPAIKGQNLRGFGWDIDTPLSTPRGMVFPIGSFGHTGFTGSTLWMDPGSDTYVVLLSNSIHLRGSPPIRTCAVKWPQRQPRRWVLKRASSATTSPVPAEHIVESRHRHSPSRELSTRSVDFHTRWAAHNVRLHRTGG